jgi:hypothetical protein
MDDLGKVLYEQYRHARIKEFDDNPTEWEQLSSPAKSMWRDAASRFAQYLN